MLARPHDSDPVFVEPFTVVETPRRIELRIGESKQGKSRYAVLTPREAQKIAIALLMQAEASLEGKTQTH
jgi:hypothetical protein